MGVRENKIEQYLNSKVVKRGGLTRKWVSPSRDGVPDRIVIWHGRVYFIEVKTLDGVTSPAQQREQHKLAKAGAHVEVLYGRAAVDVWVHRTLVE